MNATPDAQAQLLGLADTDQQIRRLDHTRANLPEQQTLDTHVQTHKNVSIDLIEATATGDRLMAESARHEQRIETANEARRHSESRIYSGQVSNERELEALREQISRAHDTKSDIEDSLIEIMEQNEEVTSLIDELTSRKAELGEQISHLTEQRDVASLEIDEELIRLQQQRADDVTALDEGLVGAYESLRASKSGRVVARLENRTCTGCQLELTAIELEEIKETARQSLAYCQQCGSIIVPARPATAAAS